MCFAYDASSKVGTDLYTEADIALGAVVVANKVVRDGACGQRAQQSTQLQAGHLHCCILHALVLQCTVELYQQFAEL